MSGTIWVVLLGIPWQGESVEGVFSSEDLAQEYINSHKRPRFKYDSRIVSFDLDPKRDEVRG